MIAKRQWEDIIRALGNTRMEEEVGRVDTREDNGGRQSSNQSTARQPSRGQRTCQRRIKEKVANDLSLRQTINSTLLSPTLPCRSMSHVSPGMRSPAIGILRGMNELQYSPESYAANIVDRRAAARELLCAAIKSCDAICNCLHTDDESYEELHVRF